jgi:hypothetical protein
LVYKSRCVPHPAGPVPAGIGHPTAAATTQCSDIRFTADLPNECWQADITHWRLVDGTEVEILDILDNYPPAADRHYTRRFYKPSMAPPPSPMPLPGTVSGLGPR